MKIGFPSAIDLISLFECEPEFINTDISDLPFVYNELTYRFSNQEEDFLVKLAPANGDVNVKVTQRLSNRLLANIEFIQVDKFEIIADEKDYARVLLITKNEARIKYIELDFKPYFKLIFKEEISE